MEVLFLVLLIIIISGLAGGAIAYYVMLRASGKATHTHKSTLAPLSHVPQGWQQQTGVKIEFIRFGEQAGMAVGPTEDGGGQTGISSPKQTRIQTAGGTGVAEGPGKGVLVHYSYGETLKLGREGDVRPGDPMVAAAMPSRVMGSVIWKGDTAYFSPESGFSQGATIVLPGQEGNDVGMRLITTNSLEIHALMKDRSGGAPIPSSWFWRLTLVKR